MVVDTSMWWSIESHATKGGSMGTPVLELTRDEIVSTISEGARLRLGMSAEQLLAAYRAGRLEDPGKVADLLALARLLRDNDPLSVVAAGK